jgi:hypothetical protein
MNHFGAVGRELAARNINSLSSWRLSLSLCSISDPFSLRAPDQFLFEPPAAQILKVGDAKKETLYMRSAVDAK